MTEQFYQKQLSCLIRENQLLKSQRRRLNCKIAGNFSLIFDLIYKILKLKDKSPIKKYFQLKQDQFLDQDNFKKLILTLQQQIYRRQKIQQAKRTQLQLNQSFTLKQSLKCQERKQLSLARQNQQNVQIIKQLKNQIEDLLEKQQMHQRQLKKTKSIAKQLQNQLIQCNFLQEKQRFLFKNEKEIFKKQILNLKSQLKKTQYSYEKLIQNTNDSNQNIVSSFYRQQEDH